MCGQHRNSNIVRYIIHINKDDFLVEIAKEKKMQKLKQNISRHNDERIEIKNF